MPIRCVSCGRIVARVKYKKSNLPLSELIKQADFNYCCTSNFL